MARIDAQFIIQTALDTAVADSEGSIIVWAKRHGIDPDEMIAAVKALVEVHADSDAAEEAYVAYFFQLGYEVRRRQQGEPPSIMPDVKLRDYMLVIARCYIKAETNLNERARKASVLEDFFDIEPGGLTNA